MMRLSYHRQAVKRAFTIVELLIVIVIIAILATITIVAYNGITQRAENTKTVNAIAEYSKIISIYAVQEGHYPITTGYPCLGELPKCARISANAGDTPCWGMGGASNNPAFNTEIRKVTNSLPEVSTQQLNCNGNIYANAHFNKNDTTNGTIASLAYFLRGDVPCDVVGAGASTARQVTDGVTFCQLKLPNL